jgi:hypothetical protein
MSRIEKEIRGYPVKITQERTGRESSGGEIKAKSKNRRELSASDT